VLFLPLIWSVIPEGFIENIRGLPLNNVNFRVDLYLYSSGIILDRWLWGYGLGSAEQMTVSVVQNKCLQVFQFRREGIRIISFFLYGWKWVFLVPSFFYGSF